MPLHCFEKIFCRARSTKTSRSYVVGDPCVLSPTEDRGEGVDPCSRVCLRFKVLFEQNTDEEQNNQKKKEEEKERTSNKVTSADFSDTTLANS